MIEGVMPYLRVKAAERSESVGNADEAAMLCISPRQWPASCAATPLRVSISSSSVCRPCGPAHRPARSARSARPQPAVTSLQMRIEALMISPVADRPTKAPLRSRPAKAHSGYRSIRGCRGRTQGRPPGNPAPRRHRRIRSSRKRRSSAVRRGGWPLSRPAGRGCRDRTRSARRASPAPRGHKPPDRRAPTGQRLANV